MDGWITKQNKDKTGHESRIFETSPRRVASFLFALSQHHRLDASCISKRVEAGTRSTFHEHLLTFAGIWIISRSKTFLHTLLVHTFTWGAKAPLQNMGFLPFWTKDFLDFRLGHRPEHRTFDLESYKCTKPNDPNQ